MNGPEHYREAERDVALANDRPMGDEASFFLARAQVHATLALAAATIQPVLDQQYDDADVDARRWADATAPTGALL